MNAKEMFKQLGYEYRELDDDVFQYSRSSSIVIRFYKKEREFCSVEYFGPKNINMDEFKAIQQQLKELGWLEEETCTNKSEYDSIEQFECSNCGFISVDHTELEINEDNGEELYQVYKPKYCPNCGRKIVD